MKYLLFGICLITLTASCTKKDPIINRTDCELIGEWRWIESSGTIAGNIWSPESTGNMAKIEIDENELHFYENGSFVQSFPYSIFETDTIFNDGVVRPFIQYGDNIRSIINQECVLELLDLFPDGIQDSYEKIQ